MQTRDEFTILKNNFSRYYAAEISNQQIIDDLEKLIQINNELELIKNKILNYSKIPNLRVNELIVESNNLLSYCNKLKEICLEFKKYNIHTTIKSIKEKMLELLELNALLNKIINRGDIGSYYFNLKSYVLNITFLL